ncbi:hypothetical protein L596_020922 [Steinernema carpocapsae]|uniref:SXP/RAL-2 family protein Ani s 5-like cation-binding domain-containing protein n=1 Tax=Steinernema carpocapsae TaxID=34508 RepID=A0A4U5MV04_STECR|nr:hypothetical protein L596_020922 [Steinernema carpocapsae]
MASRSIFAHLSVALVANATAHFGASFDGSANVGVDDDLQSVLNAGLGHKANNIVDGAVNAAGEIEGNVGAAANGASDAFHGIGRTADDTKENIASAIHKIRGKYA